MSVMFKLFFGIPQSAMRLGKIKDISGIATKVYNALCHESERHQTRELTRTVAELRALVGGSSNSHAKARTELIEAGLIQAEPYGPAGFVFVLCDPETGKPFPGHPTQRAIYQRKGGPPVAANQDATQSGKTKKPPKIEGAGTSFPFGCNDPEFVATRRSTMKTVQPVSWDECSGDRARKLSTPTRNY